MPFKIGFVILAFLVVLVIYLVILYFSYSLHIPISENNDLKNWSAVVIEIGIAVFISGMVLLYDRKHKHHLEEQQEEISKMVVQTKTQQDEMAKLISKITDLEQQQEKKYTEKEEIENRFYKVNLLAHLISGLSCIRQALSRQLVFKNKHIDEQGLLQNINGLRDDFGYWSDRITTLNSNTYVPPDIRNAVGMFTHQAIKSIDPSDMPLRYKFLEMTVFNYVDFIIDSDYVKNDTDSTIQKFRSDIIKEKQAILDFRKNYLDKDDVG